MQLTVILPVSRLEYFRDSLSSVLDAMDLYSSEVIIINTLGHEIDLYGYKNSNKVRIINIPNSSYQNAIEHGIEASTSTYIALMNDDDMTDISRFKIQIDLLESTSSDVVIGAMKKFGSTKISFNWNPDFNDFHSSMLLLGPYGANATLLARRDWISSRIKTRKYDVWDWEFAFENYPRSNVSGTNSCLYLYRQHHKQVTKTSSHRYQLEHSIPKSWVDCSLNNPRLQISDSASEAILFPYKKNIKQVFYSFFKIKSYQTRREVLSWLLWFWRAHVVKRYGLRNKAWFLYHAAIRLVVC